MKKLILFTLLVTLTAIGCVSHKTEQTGYAKLFSVEKNCSGYTILRDTAGRRIVLFRNKKPDVRGALFVRVPVKRVDILSTGVVSYLEALNATSALAGVPATDRWYYRNVEEGLKNGRIKEIGTANNPNYEEILALKPDVVFIPAKFVSKSVVEKFKSLGIPYVSCGYWLEKTPLGKVEWIKFFGYFFDKESTANRYFESVKSRILNVEKKARGLKKSKGRLRTHTER